MSSRNRTPTNAGALAADLLVDACRTGSENPLRLQIVKGLASDLGRRLADLAGEYSADYLVEAALVCADLATLAACNLSAISDDERPRATAAVHLAAGVAWALIPLIEAEAAALDETTAGNTLRDARSAGWRADLATRQAGDSEG